MTMWTPAESHGQCERQEQAAVRASRQDELQVGGAAWSREVRPRTRREREPGGCVRR